MLLFLPIRGHHPEYSPKSSNVGFLRFFLEAYDSLEDWYA